MDEDTARDDGSDGRVIFSLTVTSCLPIGEFSHLAQPRRPARADDDFYYPIHHTSFTETDWNARATQLDETIHTALDELEATQVTPEALRDRGVFVKAFFTFPNGAETLTAHAVQRLAANHATIWIDALG